MRPGTSGYFDHHHPARPDLETTAGFLPDVTHPGAVSLTVRWLLQDGVGDRGDVTLALCVRIRLRPQVWKGTYPRRYQGI